MSITMALWQVGVWAQAERGPSHQRREGASWCPRPAQNQGAMAACGGCGSPRTQTPRSWSVGPAPGVAKGGPQGGKAVLMREKPEGTETRQDLGVKHLFRAEFSQPVSPRWFL